VTAAVESLRRELGREAVEEHAPLEVAGAALCVTLRPAEGEALALAVRRLGEAGLAAVVRGSATRIGVGNPASRADVLLSSERLAGIEVLDADEGVARVRAGTKLAALRSEAEAARWELPLEAAEAEATVGGVLAQAGSGPRSARLGRPRDHVLGLDVVLGTGVRTRCGGRVVKNVTGYDLMKLHTGAHGTLGVIEAAWLRLRTLPEEKAWLAAEIAGPDAAFAAAASASRGASTRAALLLDPALKRRVDPAGAGGGHLLVLELGGRLEEVHRDRARLASELSARDSDADLMERALALRLEPDARSGLRFRVGVHAARLARAAQPLRHAGATLLACAGEGLLYAGFRLPEDAGVEAVEAAWRAARDAARAGGGCFLLEAAPAHAAAGRDVFGDPPEGLALMRALKARFDPRGVLNPGRFAGGI
jgi:glycolate oxidase FAD binding subunit